VRACARYTLWSIERIGIGRSTRRAHHGAVHQ